MAQFVDINDSITKLLEVADSYNKKQPDARASLVSVLTSFLRQVEGPPAYLSRVRLSPLLNMCMLMAMETGVLDAIVEAKEGQAMTASELAISTKQHESMIARFMRLLTVNGVCDEVAPQTYRANETAVLLSQPEQVGATRNMVDLMFPIGGRLVYQLRSQHGISQFADSPGDTTPFRATFGMSMFEYFEANAEHKEAFDQYMAGRRLGIRRHWFDYYPVQDRLIAESKLDSNNVFLVDVGGGKGYDIVDLRRKFPGLGGRCVLQDLAATLEGVNLSSQNIQIMEHNFFQEQPVQGARVYFFRSVFHDWSDKKSGQILDQTAKAMTPGYSKVIIEDMVLPDVNASWRGASLDVLMLMMVEGIERSLSHWKQLLDSSGLKISGVWYGGDGAESTIEAILKTDPASVTMSKA